MASEGCRLGVGGEAKRGGLLSTANGNNNMNAIEYLSVGIFKDAEIGPVSDEFDRKRAHALKKLRDKNLLVKADIQEYDLVIL